MTKGFIVTGTDTGVGKTVFSAGLTAALEGYYWKPVQPGLEGETDSEAVVRLTELPQDRIVAEAYRLKRPTSPHLAARKENIELMKRPFELPTVRGPLIIEGAGGLLVPYDDTVLQIDLFQQWGLPIILCARTSLGTINHSLMSVEVLRHRKMPLSGIAFIGDANPEVEQTIINFGKVRCFGRLPWMGPLTPRSLKMAFDEHIDLDRAAI